MFNDTYGTGLRNAVQETIEAAGGKIVYGGKGDGDEFPAGQTTFSSEVSGALAAKPDAIVVLAFDETKQIVPELASQGWDMSKTYFSDGNTADYSKDFEPGTLEGAQGTIPGADPDADLQGPAQRLGRGRRGQGPDRLRLRRRVLRRHHPGRPRRGQGRRDRLADHPEELRGGLRRHRRRGVHHLRRLRRAARGGQGDPLQGSVRHRSDQRQERPVVGLHRHLHVQRARTRTSSPARSRVPPDPRSIT